MRLENAVLTLLISALILLNIPGEILATEKTLSRVDDYVVVEGKVLEPALGANLDRLSLMACMEDGFRPVPFQVDEKNPDGEYVYTNGPNAGKDTDPLLDSNDELVFMVESTGPHCNNKSWPQRAKAGAEITVRDPKDGGLSWLYLFTFEQEPPRSDTDQVSVNFPSGRTTIKTPLYIMGTPKGMGFYDELHVAGSDGKMGPDILDLMKIRGVLRLFGLIEIKMVLDKMVRSETIGWIDGPVRAIVDNKAYLQIGFFKVSVPMTITIFSYPNNSISQLTYTMAKSTVMEHASKLADVEFYGAMDYNENCYGTYVYDPFNPYSPEIVFDGKMSEAEKNLNTSGDRDWIAGYQPGIVGVLNRYSLPPEWTGIKKGLHYLDDKTQKAPPEDHPGITTAGYKFKIDVAYIKPGKFEVNFIMYFKRGFNPGDEKAFLDIIDHPLEVKAVKMNQ